MCTPSTRCAALLARHPLFCGVGAVDIERLAALSRLLRAPRKQVLYTRGQPCDGFHVLVYGRVVLALVSSKGLERPLQIIEPGGSFGEVTMLLNQPHTLSASTVDDSLLVFVPRSALLEMISHDSGFALRMMASLSQRASLLVDDIEAYTLQAPLDRVIAYLLRLLPTATRRPADDRCAGAGPNGPITIELVVAKRLIARQLGLTPETLSRLFRELDQRGLVSLHGRVVCLKDVDALGALLNGSPLPMAAASG